ncbi:ATP-dependent helicase C-terminal domain-containing protein [Dactylosporangium sp. AC04546]|uniref:ATP-dependent RNA helicase n=1 Tax=Dactylosporangium sp. AC04546 TaxID=2862460 RepID=UPI001EE12BE7|nr:ATP-dependent helicase C-terminal domain-containing protein [Dactylosporangium sp. AC04546]WVK82738.1 ATP-dependent helicase C-terminal domain-containing protein [Dactylosporangium sp. AC04546]
MQALPVVPAIPRLLEALDQGAAVLVAPPGSGKTTLVPLALDEHLQDGRILVAEPRRIAARAAARRMAQLRGEQVGDSVGYAVRGDRRTGPRTRVEVVTTGLLVQRLLADPELPGVSAVVLDECHERQLDTDLAFAFLIEARATIRSDLRLLATSATAEAERFADKLAGTVVAAEGGLFPFDVRWVPPRQPMRPAEGMRVDRGFLDHVGATVRKAWNETAGDILVFLPGAAEIEQVRRQLGDAVVLHGRLPAAQQDQALVKTGTERRIVLATDVAESSLTVPGVRVVVDAGLRRVPRIDLARGLGRLVTVTAAKANATQRAGRAAREGPGTVYRCWSQADHERRAEQPEPEVATADLTGFALALACWGGLHNEALPDQPPEGAMRVARQTLEALGALDADHRVTGRGRRMQRVGAHPRLARALLDGAPLVGARTAAEVVAVLSEETATTIDDLTAVELTPATRSEADRLRRLVEAKAGERGREHAAGIIAGLAYPEWIAKRRGDGYLMAGGTEATLPRNSALTGEQWLAIAAADRPQGSVNARIRLAAPIDEETARAAGQALLSTVDEVSATGALRVERLGAITLTEQRIDAPDLVSRARNEARRRRGLPWTPLRRRMAFLHRALGAPWPDVSDDDNLADGEVDHVLQAMLPWPAAKDLDKLAPERLAVPSGSMRRVDYTDTERPVLTVKVQEAFGWLETPTVAGVQVVLHLLSPAERPVAVTQDLASFWRNGYPQVRAELRGRYPRHPWPEDPLTAEPTRRTKQSRTK